MMLATEIDPDGIATLRLDNQQSRNALSIVIASAWSARSPMPTDFSTTRKRPRG